jgi:extracellular factor (EF) 3-hydroxypalmitic acid methyl ester biosynthesis protein
MSSSNAMKQEGFLIQDENSPRKKIVRQDRVPIMPKKFFMSCEKLRLEICNVSSFGIAVICTENEMLGAKEVFNGGDSKNSTLSFNDTEFQSVKLKIARIEKHPHSTFDDYIVGFESVGDSVAVDCIKALELTEEMIINTNQALVQTAQIPNEFKLLVFEMQEFLNQLKCKIESLEKLAPRDNAVENSDFRQTVAQSISNYLNKIIPSKYQKIPDIFAKTDDQILQYCSEFMRSHLGPLVYGAPFAHRAYNKPRGYAGDYEMMNHLYRNEMVGSSLFDQCMHKYFIDEPAGQAVKNRGYYLLEKIKETVQSTKKSKIKILAVASGPAMEQQLFLKNCPEFRGRDIEFVCIDQDEESLKHAQREILSIDRFAKSGFEFRFRNLAIKNILARGLPEQDFDLIYTAGLFDYFTDPVALLAAQKLFAGLKDNGTLIIGNFSKDNPSQPFMEMVLEWHLLYRSVQEMTTLFGQVGKSLTIEKESLGINLFAVIKK